MSDPASIKAQLSAQFSVDVPPPLEHAEPEAVAALIGGKAAAGTVKIVDVRLKEEFCDGHIRSAVNIPLDELNVAELCAEVKALRAEAKKAGKTFNLVFTSLQSPDIDDAAAVDFAAAWEATDEGKADPAAGFVQLLLGGVFYWLDIHRNNAELTENYNSDKWEAVLSKHAATTSN